MIEIRRILCPTDFSETSHHALEHAVAMARWYGSAITALHVVYVPLVPQPPILAAAVADPVWPSSPGRAAREEELRVWLEPARRAGVTTEAVVDEGNVVGRILDHATSRQADLIVMGTHGLSGFERFMLGSVAEKVLRKAPCPVMTVPPASATNTKIPYAQLLCPVDFSDSSLAALQFAYSLAQEANANLTILHVFDWSMDDELLVGRFDASEFRQHVDERARERLEALVTDEVRQWCTPSTKMAYGKPYREILSEAASAKADLIIIGVRGRNPVDVTMFGSTTNQVVRRASCPVLTLRQ